MVGGNPSAIQNRAFPRYLSDYLTTVVRVDASQATATTPGGVLVLHMLAYAPDTDTDTRVLLSRQTSYTVRRGVALNPNTPLELLGTLATDDHAAVRNGVAENQNTPLELLGTLAIDTDASIRSTALANWRDHILAGHCTDIEIAEYYALQPDDTEVGNLLTEQLLRTDG